MPLEVMSPAGSFEALTAAVRAGADAVYFGAGEFNARRNAKNFTEEDAMRGQILVFNELKEAGAIVATDGQRFLFHARDPTNPPRIQHPLHRIAIPYQVHKIHLTFCLTCKICTL